MFKVTDTVLPIMQSQIWYQDFYNFLWKNENDSNFILLIELLENNDPYSASITAYKINNDDGTIKYGLYEFPMYAYPLK